MSGRIVFHMSTTATHIPANLTGASWTDQGRRASYGAARPGFGVKCVATGEFLSSDGVKPSVWSSKAIASVIAADPMPWATVPVTF